MRAVLWSPLLVAVLAASLAGAVLAVGLHLSSPATASPGPAPPGAEPVAINSGSGSTLRGWWIPGDGRGGGVILMHGVRSNRASMLRRAEMLHAHGFAVLLFDFQAHGESSGRRISYGRLEAMDAAAAVAFARQRMPTGGLGAVGVSLGGAAALLGPEPLRVDALVLESVYADINSALENRLRTELGPLLGPVATPVLAPVFRLLMPPILGVSPDELRPIDRIGRVAAPLLVASGTADDRTPIEEARALFARAPEPKQFRAVEGARHVDLEAHDPAAYWAMMLPFLERTLRQGNQPAPTKP